MTSDFIKPFDDATKKWLERRGLNTAPERPKQLGELMTHTSSKKEESAFEMIDRQYMFSGVESIDEAMKQNLAKEVEKFTSRRVTQALKELKEEACQWSVQDAEMHDYRTGNELTYVPIEAIDNKIKELEQS